MDSRTESNDSIDVDAHKRQTFQHLVLHHRLFCQQCRENVHSQDPGGWDRKRTRGAEYLERESTIKAAPQERLGGRPTNCFDEVLRSFQRFALNHGRYCESLENMGKSVPDERYEGIIVQVLSAESKGV